MMSETENDPPGPVQDQIPKTKGSPLANVNSSNRTPFRDIANDPKSMKTPLKNKLIVTPSRFEATTRLDEEQSMRDRTEVLTNFDHTAYHLYAIELIDQVLENLPGGSNEAVGTPKKEKFPNYTNFRETASGVMDDSAIEAQNDTICSPALDKTLDTLNFPIANSNLLNSTKSYLATPDRSDGVFETLLLSSFEKMKIREEEEAEEDIFHDASDEFETHDDAVPEKDVFKDNADKFLDPLHILTNSLEKILVHDIISEATDQSETAIVPVRIERRPVVEAVDLLPAGEQKEKRSPVKENFFTTIVMSDGKENPENTSDDGVRGKFDDPDFNPFLTIAPAGKAIRKEKLVAKSPLPSISTAEDAAVGSFNAEKDSGGLKDPSCLPASLKNLTIHSPPIKLSLIHEETNVLNNSSVELNAAESKVDKNFIPSEKMMDVKNLEEFKYDPFTSRTMVANSPPGLCHGDVDMSNFLSAKSSADKEKEVLSLEKNHNLENMEQLLDPCSINVTKGNSLDSPKHTLSNAQEGALPLKNSPMEVLNKEEHSLSVIPVYDSAKKYSGESLSRAFVNELDIGQVENEALPSKGEYNFNILNDLDDPNCNPFATRSAVANSPAHKISPSKSSKLSEMERSENNFAEVNPVTEKTNSAEIESLNIVTSPKRKYEEAFLDDDNFDCLAEIECTTGIGHPDDEVMQPKDDVATSNFLEKSADSQEDIVVLKKDDNLKFLDAIGDDPNFNPFTTKSAVTNTPEKKDRSESNKKAVVGTIFEHEDSKENRKESEVRYDQDLPLINRPVDDIKVKECPVKDVLNEVSKGSAEKNEAEPAAPSKCYNFDFLDNLDDPNFNPFATKASVTNSPGKMSPGFESEVKASESKSEVKTSESKSEVKTSESKSEMKTSESKSEVNASDLKSKAAEIKNKNRVSTACKDKKLIAKNEQTELKKNEKRAKKVTMQVEMEYKDQEKKQQEAEEDLVVPSEGYQLDFLDTLDDPNINPFETKSAVSNSPSRDLPVTVPETQAVEANAKTSVEKKREQVPIQKVQTNNGEKIINKSVHSKGFPFNIKLKEDCKGDSKVNEEIKTSQQENEIDFVNKFDGPDFNPFVTKSVLKSPERDTKVSKEKLHSSGKTSHETSDIISSPGKAEANSLLADIGCEVKTNKVETGQTKADEVKMTSHTLQKHEDEQSVPKNEYQLDILNHFDDPNFNPFATKSAVSNSPKKEADGKSIVDTETEKPLSDTEHKDVSSSLASTEECQSVTKKSISRYDKLFLSKVESNDFDQISQEAFKLVADVTPSKRKLSEMRTLKVSSQVQQNDVFSPLLDSKFEQFVNATDLSQEQHDPVEGEQFQSASCYTLFNNPDDLDVLGRHGTDGDKLNLVRNSLFMKFDPLVSGRQSLAPYLAQQKLFLPADDDPRRASGLISFSPSPDKQCRKPIMSSSRTPVRPLFKTQADETVVVDATSLNDATLCSALNTTVVASSSQFNNSVISHGVKFPDDSVFQHPAAFGENMIPEQVMNERIKNMEMVMQDKLLRQSRALEDMQKTIEQQAEESSIALSSLEDENTSLRSTIQKLQALIQKVVDHGKIKEEEKKREIVLLENKYELQCKALKEESRQYQEDLKKMEEPFYDLVKKYTRLQEVTESLRRNEESLKAEIDFLLSKLTKKEESFKTVLQTLEENYMKAQQEYQAEKEQHEQELNKAFVILKKAELKIMSLTDTVEKTQNENRRLNDLVDDISNKFS